MKKRKLTKKERKAQRNADREARGLPPGWARSEMMFAESEAAFWRNEFGVDVDEIGPALVEKVIARDKEWRARHLERSVERWSSFGYWQCTDCGYLDAWPGDVDRQSSTCMECGAAMGTGRTGDDVAEWAERGPVLDLIDVAETERARAKLLGDWVEDHVREVRQHADDVEFDLAWGPAEVLDEVQGGVLDGVIDDLRCVDWRVVARDVAAWLDDHPREVDPVDFLEIANDLLDDV